MTTPEPNLKHFDTKVLDGQNREIVPYKKDSFLSKHQSIIYVAFVCILAALIYRFYPLKWL